MKRNFFPNELFDLKLRSSYEPWYNDKSDYNTNAKSYYDYLARFKKGLEYIIDAINRALNRDLSVLETDTAVLEKIGKWIGDKDENNIYGEYDDIITLKANVKISKKEITETLTLLTETIFTFKNAIKIDEEGLFVFDYKPVFEKISMILKELKQQVDKNTSDIISLNAKLNNFITEVNMRFQTLETKIATLEDKVLVLENNVRQIQNTVNIHNNAIKKILSNLFQSGAITTNNIESYEFNINRNIATGNINFFSSVPDGDYYIRTNDLMTENDIVAGY